jgi:hypothetical protein
MSEKKGERLSEFSTRPKLQVELRHVIRHGFRHVYTFEESGIINTVGGKYVLT